MTDNIGKQIEHSKLLSQITSAAVCVLLALFFLVTMSSMTTIKNQVEALKNDPFPVSVAAGRIETLLVQSQTIAQNASFSNDVEAAEQMREQYKKVNSELAEKILYVRQSNILSEEFDDVMRESYNQLVKNEATLVRMCGDPAVSGEEAHDYAQTHVIPLIAKMVDENANLINISTERVDDVYSSIKKALDLNIIFAWILIVAVVVSIFVFLTILRRKDRREARLRENLSETAQLANAANEAKSTFLSSMSHDIRTPLNAIVGFTALARNSMNDPAKQSAYLEHIDVASRHLLSLINDVLDMSEIESGRITLNEAPFYPNEFIAEFVTLVQPLADAKHQDLTINYETGDKDLLIGDTMRLKQVILNLVSNAVKYTPEGGAINVSLMEEPSERENYVNYRITVADNGIGMSEDFLKDIFTPFEREHSSMTSKTEGAGLGMTITKNVVGMMGGTIEVQSELGVGSMFTVVIPFEQATESQAAHHAIVSPDAEREWNEEAVPIEDKPEMISGRVLLVEDDPLNQEIAVELISQTGAEVETANDGVEAVERVQEVDPGYYGMIFMDFRMPRMDGLEATAKIVEYEQEKNIPHTPIIALTANAFNEDRESAAKAGMDDFITKPINLDELRRMLRKYLSH